MYVDSYAYYTYILSHGFYFLVKLIHAVSSVNFIDHIFLRNGYVSNVHSYIAVLHKT